MPDQSVKNETTSGGKTRAAGKAVKRPLVPLVLALMLGIAAADWGLQIPRSWLLLMLAGLLVVLSLLYFFNRFSSKKDSPKEPQ